MRASPRRRYLRARRRPRATRSPTESEVAAGPDSPPASRVLQAQDPRLRMVEVVQGHLVRWDRRIPFRRAGVQAFDPDAALPVEHPDDPVRSLVQLPADRPAPIQLREARVRHEADDLAVRDRAADRAQGPLEQLVRLSPLDVLVKVHLREAGEDREACRGLLELFIEHVQY